MCHNLDNKVKFSLYSEYSHWWPQKNVLVSEQRYSSEMPPSDEDYFRPGSEDSGNPLDSRFAARAALPAQVSSSSCVHGLRRQHSTWRCWRWSCWHSGPRTPAPGSCWPSPPSTGAGSSSRGSVLIWSYLHCQRRLLSRFMVDDLEHPLYVALQERLLQI